MSILGNSKHLIHNPTSNTDFLNNRKKGKQNLEEAMAYIANILCIILNDNRLKKCHPQHKTKQICIEQFIIKVIVVYMFLLNTNFIAEEKQYPVL